MAKLVLILLIAFASILSLSYAQLPTMLKTLHTWPPWENNVVSVSSYPSGCYGYGCYNNYYNRGRYSLAIIERTTSVRRTEANCTSFSYVGDGFPTFS